MEIAPALYEANKVAFPDTTVSFFLGDSVECLKDIVPLVLEGAVFFLDGHMSNGDTWWNEKQRVPLYEELDVILSHKIGPSVLD
jgi:hypothetical protein